MREHTLTVLQYKKVCKDFSQYATTEEGKALCENLKPMSNDIEEIVNLVEMIAFVYCNNLFPLH